jgi:hypothetical protein
MQRGIGWSIVFGVLLTTGAGTARADAVTDCAVAQGKALAALFADITKEAARACGKGSAQAPLAISQAKAGAAMGKLYAKLGKAVDKAGAPSCFIKLDALDAVAGRPSDILAAMESLADRACLVPVGP